MLQDFDVPLEVQGMDNIAVIGSEAELASIAGALCNRSDCTKAELALIKGPRANIVITQAVRGLILAGEDPLGEAFLALRSPTERRQAGAVYTPPPIISRMLAWAALQGEPTRIVDPGAGSGRFVFAAAKHWPAAQLVACEIDPLAALMLRARATVLGLAHRLHLFVGDYRVLELAPNKGATLFIGNPPYVRHHQIEQLWKTWFFETSKQFGFKASKLAGLHAHFFLRTRQLAQKGDFGAFVTSSEWLDVNYGGIIRDMLGNGLGGTAIDVIDAGAMPFSDAMTTAAISCFNVGSHEPAMRMAAVPHLSGQTGNEEAKNISWQELKRASRWSVFIKPSARRAGSSCVGDLFRVHRGQVTGANKVWIEGEYKGPLPERFLHPTVTKAHELFAARKSLGDVAASLRRVIYLPNELDALDVDERRQVNAFLEWAKSRGAHESFTAKQRRRWWSVPVKQAPAILCTYMARRAPAIVLNDIDARYINIALGLYPKQPMDTAVLRAVAAYLRENICVSEGRTYAGGLVKFEPRELEAVALPELEALMAAGVPPTVTSIVTSTGLN